jgi:hypothetical protein
MELCQSIVFGGPGADRHTNNESDQSGQSGIDFDEIAVNDYGDSGDYTTPLLSTPPPFSLQSLPSLPLPSHLSSSLDGHARNTAALTHQVPPCLLLLLDGHVRNTAPSTRQVPPRLSSSPLSSINEPSLSEEDIPLATQFKQI